jgi:2-keto-4-pentenoate hydratase/2-oxohepta-3-ene-1,7-dioic acid hydratase in catechol pathway
VVDDHGVALRAIDSAPTDVTALLEAGPEVGADVVRKGQSVSDRVPLGAVHLQPPIGRPSKYLAIGFNFSSHLDEIHRAAQQSQYAEAMQCFAHLRQAFPDQKLPTFFNKQVSCITGPYDPILAPHGSPVLDYEGELAAVIGRRVRRVDPATALASVAGYTVGNDVSVRDWQQDTPTMWPGKSFDTHGPLGPWIVTADELRQHGSTKEMVTGIGEMVAALSCVCTLEPGDLVATGTPGRVGMFSGKLLQPKQRIRVEIEGIGTIDNPVVAEPESIG